MRCPCFGEMDTSASKNNPQGLNSFQGLSCALWGYPRDQDPGGGRVGTWVLQEQIRLRVCNMGESWLKSHMPGVGSAAHSGRPWEKDDPLPTSNVSFFCCQQRMRASPSPSCLDSIWCALSSLCFLSLSILSWQSWNLPIATDGKTEVDGDSLP